MDNIILAYYLGLLLFGLNGIMWLAVSRKYKQVKLMQEASKNTLMRVIKSRRYR
jgi:hypothetical protein